MIAKSKKQKKSKFRINEDTIFQGIFIFLIVFLAGFLIVSNYRIIKKRGVLNEKIEELTEEIQALEAERQNLEAGISQTQKDIYWEEKIREQGYVKEGEEQVVILGSEQSEVQESSTEQNFFQKIFEGIKSFFNN
ncbi:MAG: septum formation initiator family protein [Patescibacteria group bacterium]|nr:septum formation initiator family protein [Patescibacteria group bacterium]